MHCIDGSEPGEAPHFMLAVDQHNEDYPPTRCHHSRLVELLESFAISVEKAMQSQILSIRQHDHTYSTEHPHRQ